MLGTKRPYPCLIQAKGDIVHEHKLIASGFFMHCILENKRKQIHIMLIALFSSFAVCQTAAYCAESRKGVGHFFKGIASFYAGKFHGRKTASGEIYDQNRLTCAHRTLPFGTKLIVRNLDNGSECEVEVNDRGPFVKRRVVDLSKAAAKKLGITGLAHVVCTSGERVAKGVASGGTKVAKGVVKGVDKIVSDDDEKFVASLEKSHTSASMVPNGTKVKKESASDSAETVGDWQ